MKKEKVVNCINELFKNIKTYENALESFKMLDEYFKSNEYILDKDTIIYLLTTNTAFIKATNLIFTKNKKAIIKDEIKFANMTLFLTIEIYCQLNNVKVQKNAYYDKNYEESETYTDDILRAYLNDVGNQKILTPEQEVELAKKIAAGDDKAKEKLIEANLKLVISIAKRYTGSGIQLIDLIQEGNLGLMTAIERFDVKKGFKFSTYASQWINSFIIRFINNQARTIRIPVYRLREINKYTKVRTELRGTLKREPTIEEIANVMEISIENVKELYESSHKVISLNTPTGEDRESEFGDFLKIETPSPEDVAIESSIKELIIEVLSTLKPEEEEVIKLRYGLDGHSKKTLEEIGQMMELTRQRIKQIEDKALEKLRHPTRINKLIITDEPLIPKKNQFSSQASSTTKLIIDPSNLKSNFDYKNPIEGYSEKQPETSQEVLELINTIINSGNVSLLDLISLSKNEEAIKTISNDTGYPPEKTITSLKSTIIFLCELVGFANIVEYANATAYTPESYDSKVYTLTLKPQHNKR